VNLSETWRYRWHAARLIQRRDLRSTILGIGIYVVLSTALLASALILRNHLNFVDENGLLVLSGAFVVPLFTTIFLCSLFLALSSVATIAREKDQGTMQVLFYGPVDSLSYILGKYLAQMFTYLGAVVVFGGCFVLYAALTNFNFPFGMAAIILLSVLIASDLIAFGIFLSTLSSSVRGALMLFLGVVLVFGVIQAGHELLISLPSPSRYYNPLLFLKNVLAFLNDVAGWLSPFSYLNRGMSAVQRGSVISFLLVALISAGYTMVFLGLSMVTLERKGVRK
jgi:ABC-type transport system involved in multi-copper enzyme maturation permease subunit